MVTDTDQNSPPTQDIQPIAVSATARERMGWVVAFTMALLALLVVVVLYATQIR